MKRHRPSGFVPAALLFCAFAIPAAAGPLPALTEKLETWLDANAPWPRRDRPPAIRVLPPALAAQPDAAARHDGRLRGLYDADKQTITLLAPWNPNDPTDQSVLLHELAHHRQAPFHWYCPGAEERAAYRLQADWAAENGAHPKIDWFRVTLAAGCTPRDIHPD